MRNRDIEINDGLKDKSDRTREGEKNKKRYIERDKGETGREIDKASQRGDKDRETSIIQSKSV